LLAEEAGMIETKAERLDTDGGVAAACRRAPFSDNPRVGARGQRTRQRILDAALQAFGEDGYHGCNIDRITNLARCSRVSFYQYFASKEDVFRNLAGQVARQVSASTDTLDALTPDRQGWVSMRAWVGRYAEIHARYEPVFHALESDDVLARVARSTGEETIAKIQVRLATTTLTPRQLEAVIRLLMECLNHTLDVSDIFRSVVPADYPRERVEIALTDVVHRTLFGVLPDVNVHTPEGSSPTTLESGPVMLEMLLQDGAADPNTLGNRTLDALVSAGRAVFIDRGYHNTRVEDIAAAAGVSYGAFYRHFRNKDQLARMLTARAVQSVGTTVMEIPDLFTLEGQAAKVVLRRWLRRYHISHANEAAMLRVWVDAAVQDPVIRASSAPLLDWGRRRFARYLRPRSFGDVDIEAVVMVALLGVLGTRQRTAADVDAAAHVIERGLLGR
jgi:AcrR family transcriptional regulator